MNRRRHSRLRQQARKYGSIAGVGILPMIFIWWIFGSAPVEPPQPEKATTPAPPPPPPDSITRVEGWIPYWGDPVGTTRSAIAAGFTDLLFFGATLASDGKMKLDRHTYMKRAIDLAHESGVSSWLTVTNHGKSLAKVLVPNKRKQLVDRIIATFKASGCKHLDLDLETLTGAQWKELPHLAVALREKLPKQARLSMTLQPADTKLRPWAVPHVKAMLQDPGIFVVRFMCYDYHWRTSLPGALYSRPAFNRLLDCYKGHEEKLCMALPLYGYDWPRPENVSVPSAKVVTMSELPEFTALAGVKVKWMEEEGELAVVYQNGDLPRMAAVPSLRTIADRSEIARQRGLTSVAFWHLGCGRLASVRNAIRPGENWKEDPKAIPTASWASVLDPYKEKNCRAIIAKPTDSFATLAKQHRVSASALYLFNEHLTDRTMKGKTVYLPLAKIE